ncbi:FAD-dependent oxidoreductase [Nonomuraea sp. LP-02]|uniref:oxidoreductase n=1 Tax=Nonomuraea sp. LP-02 TaxID=3097960 RepID=UPI002E32E701|nr:FAD-dependent oxidoreductase [Nonomuraea sp. LP-02]MED7931856.1 FAD-dependent oxidoreductase [Nonomuraea sp. LP-02]
MSYVTSANPLGLPLALGPARLRNRFVSAPMERNYCELDGTVTPRYLHYLARRARGGAALVFAEAAYVRADGRGRLRQLGIDADARVSGLARLAEAVQAEGALFGVELNHGGRTAQGAVNGFQPVAPSPIPCRPAGGETPRELTTAEVYELIQDYAQGARRCREAGVDVISIHGAHGYLVHQFLSPAFNLRTDEFADPLRFLDLVIDAVRRQAGPGVAVGLRVSAHEGFDGGLTPERTFELISRSRLDLLDFLDVSAGSYEAGQWIIQPGEWERGLLAPHAERYRALGLPVGVAGRINTPDSAEAIVAGGQADFVSLARTLHADPDFPRHALTGAPYRPCIACNHCIDQLGTGEPIPCSVNTRAGREYAGVPHAPAKKASVVVVGAGPAGLEAARLLAGQGHQVRVLERGRQIGGQFALAGRLRVNPEFPGILRWCAGELDRLGVPVLTGVAVTAEVLARHEADAIVLATGGTGRLPDIPGVHLPHVVDVRRWLARGEDVPGACVVWGADREGVAVADHLASGGAEVTLIGSQPEPAPDVGRRAKILMVPRLTENPNVHLLLDSAISSIEPGRLLLRTGGGEEWRPVSGRVLISQGVVPRTGLLAACEARRPRFGVHVIGDAAGSGGSIHRCFLAAEEAASAIARACDGSMPPPWAPSAGRPRRDGGAPR